ncbi:MAG: choice-of-anchor Q domain-containing protein, partial [Planctomycetota bacterium]
MRRMGLNRWFVVSVVLLAAGGTAAGRVIYVDADAVPGGNGETWAKPYKYLQDALADAISNRDVNEIRVAQGTYRPDEDASHPDGTGDRTATFQLINGVALKGSYAGFGEADPNARDVELYETTLSGDLDDNDADVNEPGDLLSEPTRGENSCHVVTGSGTDATGVLDGFTITGGNAYGPITYNYGGGMYNRGHSNPTVTNCILSGNSAYDGGGMCNIYNSSPMITGCTFRRNSATDDGGGMCNISNSNPILNGCTFSDNSAKNLGGGIFNLHSNSRVERCTFWANSATQGGGICNYLSKPTVEGCTFSNNSVSQGGGIFNTDSNPIVKDCIFTGNLANSRGGGMYNWYSSPKVEGCTFTANIADRYGVGMFNFHSRSRPAVTNCILWADTPSEIYGGRPIVTYSDVQGGWAGEGNMDADPVFFDAVDGDYHLLPGSPCIDAGDPNYVPAPNEADLDGNPRAVDGDNDGNTVVDMGAYEFFMPPVEVALRFTPEAVNPGSKGKWVKAHFVLPEGYAVDDVDTNSPAKITEPFEPDVESEYMNVFINEDGLVEIEAAFGRGE